MSDKAAKREQYPELAPILEINKLADTPKEFSFKASNQLEAEKWQKEFRNGLAECLGFINSSPYPPSPVLIDEVEREDHTRRKFIISTSEHSKMPVYLLTPKNIKPPYPTVIAYEGHCYGVKDIIGLWEDGEERTTPDHYQYDFGLELCKRGFMVAAPEIAGFGERQNSFDHLNGNIGEPIPSTCHQIAFFAIMLGKSALGLRLRDSLRLVDFLETQNEADTKRLGVMGISGGGMMALHHAALDERVKAAVVSGYLSSYQHGLLRVFHCPCNFAPGLLKLCEHEDVGGLIAPRAAFFECGTRDSIFPIDTAIETFGKIKEIYKTFGVKPEQMLEQEVFEGRHQINGKRCYDFLAEQLK